MPRDPITEIKMPELDRWNSMMERDEQGMIELKTGKAVDGRIYSRARVMFVHQGPRARAITFELYGDFARTYAQTLKPERATQTALDKLHRFTFTDEKIEQIKAEVLAFYAHKREEEAQAA